MKLHAMVVDDSKVMRSMVMQSLRHTRVADFDFTEADDGEDALNKLQAKTPDIVFVDWNMPRMSGIEFVRKVRRLHETRQLPIIMVTSERAIGRVVEATEEAGADAYIRKPFTVDDLEKSVGPIIDRLAKAAAPTSGGGFFARLMKGS